MTSTLMDCNEMSASPLTDEATELSLLLRPLQSGSEALGVWSHSVGEEQSAALPPREGVGYGGGPCQQLMEQ